jgi:ABC-type antimicrobial peptide transport system ATPase subunit
MLQLNHVRKHFEELTAVDDVSLEIREGEIVGLVGENGALLLAVPYVVTLLILCGESVRPRPWVVSAPSCRVFPMASLPARCPPHAARRRAPPRSGEQLHPLEHAANPDGRR